MGDRDYLANLKLDPDDKLDSGVKGMRWGIRKSDSSSGSSTSKSGEAPTSAGSAHGSETSAQRYTRLLGQAKQKGGNSLTDDDLRFVTQRGDAINKVNRLNERKPGWAAEAAKQVLLQAAKKQLSKVADGVADKYISEPLAPKKSE